MGKRVKTPGEGQWFCPGGKPEPVDLDDFTLQADSDPRFHEETGVYITEADLVPSWSETASGAERYFLQDYVYECTTVTQADRLPVGIVDGGDQEFSEFR